MQLWVESGDAGYWTYAPDPTPVIVSAPTVIAPAQATTPVQVAPIASADQLPQTMPYIPPSGPSAPAPIVGADGRVWVESGESGSWQYMSPEDLARQADSRSFTRDDLTRMGLPINIKTADVRFLPGSNPRQLEVFFSIDAKKWANQRYSLSGDGTRWMKFGALEFGEDSTQLSDAIKGAVFVAAAVAAGYAVEALAAGASSTSVSGAATVETAGGIDAAVATGATEVGGTGLSLSSAGAATGSGLAIPVAPAVGASGAGLTLTATQVATFAPSIGQAIAAVAPVSLGSLISSAPELSSVIPSSSEVAASSIGAASSAPSTVGGAAATIGGTAPSVGATGGVGMGSIFQGGSLGEFVGAIPEAVQTAAQTVGAAATIAGTVQAVVNPDGTQSLPPVTVTAKKKEFPWWLVAAIVGAAFSI